MRLSDLFLPESRGPLTSKPRQEDRIVRQIRIRTNRGWYPSVGYYGRAHVDEYKMIEAPRVRGLFGWKGDLVHSVGLNYLALSDSAKSRAYLLAMEPYLFPRRDYRNGA